VSFNKIEKTGRNSGLVDRNHYSFKEKKIMFEGLLQPTHLLLIVGLALLMFGPKKLPELGKGLGEGIRGFKKAISNIDSEK
jgi:TatA/E family protein of Tat protein translocase